MQSVEVIARTFVELADTLVDEYDTIEFLELLTARTRDLLDVNEVGVSLVDARGQLDVLASSSERMRMVELIEVQRYDGPCIDSWRTGRSVRADDLAVAEPRWPVFVRSALDAGFASAYAVPMRLRDRRVGALNMFADRPHALSESSEVVAQALADVATIGILHERYLRESQDLATQLQHALTSRIVLEQAKGVLAEQGALDVDEAFDVLRGFARRSNQRLTEVAQRVVERELSLDDLRAAPPA